jgi:hypothetical protein
MRKLRKNRNKAKHKKRSAVRKRISKTAQYEAKRKTTNKLEREKTKTV